MGWGLFCKGGFSNTNYSTDCMHHSLSLFSVNSTKWQYLQISAESAAHHGVKSDIYLSAPSFIKSTFLITSAYGCISERHIPFSTSMRHQSQEEFLVQSETMQEQTFLTALTITM
jgi:hypothetical protein